MWFFPLLLSALGVLSAEEHPIVRLMPGSTLVGGSRVEDDGEMILSFRGEDGRVRETVRGRHWSLEADLGPGVSRDAIVEFFDGEARELSGSQVLRRADNRLTFRFQRPDGGDSWCDLWATDGNYALEIVDEPPEALGSSPKPEPNAVSVAQPEVLGVIRFGAGGARLGPSAGAVLDAVAGRALGSPALRLELRGYRTPGEPAGLAEARARAVAQALALFGVPAEQLELTARVDDDEGRVAVGILTE